MKSRIKVKEYSIHLHTYLSTYPPAQRLSPLRTHSHHSQHPPSKTTLTLILRLHLPQSLSSLNLPQQPSPSSTHAHRRHHRWRRHARWRWWSWRWWRRAPHGWRRWPRRRWRRQTWRSAHRHRRRTWWKRARHPLHALALIIDLPVWHRKRGRRLRRRRWCRGLGSGFLHRPRRCHRAEEDRRELFCAGACGAFVAFVFFVGGGLDDGPVVLFACCSGAGAAGLLGHERCRFRRGSRCRGSGGLQAEAMEGVGILRQGTTCGGRDDGGRSLFLHLEERVLGFAAIGCC